MGTTSSSTRRRFLAALAAAGSSAMARVPAAARLIDVHHHILPPVYMSAARDRIIAQGQGYLPPSVLEWTPEKALAEMDRSGVATAIVSLSTPGIWFGDVHAARTLAHRCNDYAARLASDHPGRFGFFAAIPLPDTEGSLREIAHALDVLKADGIGLMTSYGDKWPGYPGYEPVFQELNRRKAVVYFHPTAPSCCGNLIPYVPQSTIEYPHDTTRAVTSLLFSGALGRYPDIRYVFSHAGGTVPMLAGRIARRMAVTEIAENLPHGVEYELRRLYYEIAASAERPAMAALTSLVPLSQILFGSDYPWLRIDVTSKGMEDAGLSSADREAIGYENATALFPRFTAR